VQTALDRADGGLEFLGHFVDRPAVEVKGHQRFAIHSAEAAQSAADLVFAFTFEQNHQRRAQFDAVRIQHVGVGRGTRSAAHQAVYRHAVGNRAQPTAEAAGIFQLIDFSHRLEEYVLAEFLGFGVIVQAAVGRGVDGPLEILYQPSECLPVAALSGVDGFGQGCIDLRYRGILGIHDYISV